MSNCTELEGQPPRLLYVGAHKLEVAGQALKRPLVRERTDEGRPASQTCGHALTHETQTKNIAMKLKTLLTAAMLASSGLIVAGCAHEGHERETGQIFDDAATTTKVRAALLAEKDVNSFDISVKTFEGTVQLSGFVDSQWQIDKAVQVATGVEGVAHVKSNLIHKPKT